MAAHYIYNANGFLTGVYEGDGTPENSTTLPPVFIGGKTPQFLNGAWVDQSKAIAIPPTVGPIAFQLLFTSDERIEADALKATDPYIKDFWKFLDDPRTDIVDMSLGSVQNSIRHTLEAVKAAGIDVDVDARFAQILTGIPQ